MDCIISAFPDEYHLHTLEDILETCTKNINPRCDVKVIFIRLMGRFINNLCSNLIDSPILQQIPIKMSKKSIQRSTYSKCSRKILTTSSTTKEKP